MKKIGNVNDAIVNLDFDPTEVYGIDFRVDGTRLWLKPAAIITLRDELNLATGLVIPTPEPTPKAIAELRTAVFGINVALENLEKLSQGDN
jgi:hypothetical protein